MKTALIIIGIIVLGLGIGLAFMMKANKEIQNLVINEVDLTGLQDGTYSGSFGKRGINSKVEVTVKDHQIIAITNVGEFADNHSKKAAEGATKEIIDKQSLDVDVVSGASLNAKIFQKAVENALTEGIKD